MTKTLAIIAALAFTLTAAPSFAAGGPPYTLDKAGKCHDSKGFAKQSLCKPPAPAGKGVKCGNSYIAANKVCHKK